MIELLLRRVGVPALPREVGKASCRRHLPSILHLTDTKHAGSSREGLGGRCQALAGAKPGPYIMLDVT